MAVSSTRGDRHGLDRRRPRTYPHQRVDGWELRVSGPADARHIAVLLPGGLSNAAFFDLMLIDERLDERSVRLVAATPPGFGGLPAPKQLDFEWYASISGRGSSSTSPPGSRVRHPASNGGDSPSVMIDWHGAATFAKK